MFARVAANASRHWWAGEAEGWIHAEEQGAGWFAPNCPHTPLPPPPHPPILSFSSFESAARTIRIHAVNCLCNSSSLKTNFVEKEMLKFTHFILVSSSVVQMSNSSSPLPPFPPHTRLSFYHHVILINYHHLSRCVSWASFCLAQ